MKERRAAASVRRGRRALSAAAFQDLLSSPEPPSGLSVGEVCSITATSHTLFFFSFLFCLFLESSLTLRLEAQLCTAPNRSTLEKSRSGGDRRPPDRNLSPLP